MPEYHGEAVVLRIDEDWAQAAGISGRIGKDGDWLHGARKNRQIRTSLIFIQQIFAHDFALVTPKIPFESPVKMARTVLVAVIMAA